MKLITFIFTLITINSCGNSKESLSGNEKLSNNPLQGEYTIHLLNNTEASITHLTLTFNDSLKTISGFSGCNRFSGKYETNGNTIKIGPLASTKMLCQEANNEIETKIFQALSNTNKYVLENEILTLKKDASNLIEAKKQESNITITYRASTRGFFELITISKDMVTITNDRNLKKIFEFDLPEDDKKVLMNMISEIDVETLDKLEAPSKTHQYDAAASATLKLDVNNQSYQTPVFDHGNPPKSIENIVSKVLSMKKIVDKK